MRSVRLIVAVAVAVTVSVVPLAQASVGPQTLSTPELIAGDEAAGRVDNDTALRYLAYALFAPPKLPKAYRSDRPWDGTLPILRLREAAESGRRLGGGANDLIDHLSPGVRNCSILSMAPMTHAMVTDNFRVEYVPGTIGGGLTIRDYAGSLEGAWAKHVDEFGWAAPPLDAPRYRVRVDRLTIPGLYGFVASTGNVGQNPNADWSTHNAQTSCMGLNANYAGFPGTPRQALDATTAHEFHHSVQFGYGALSPSPDSSFVEGGATWMEDEVYDDSNDNHNFLWPQFTQPMGRYTGSPYAYWITFRGLTERFGTGTEDGGQRVMRLFWRTLSENNNNQQLSALDSALQTPEFGLTLAEAYHDYAIAAGSLVTCGGGYVIPHCFKEAGDYVSRSGRPGPHGIVTSGSSFSWSLADHFALNWVELPTGEGQYTVALDDLSSLGVLRASAFCDTGVDLRVDALGVLSPGGSASVLFDSDGCVRARLVVTNERVSGPSPYAIQTAAYQVSVS